MLKRKARPSLDIGLEQINELEACIIRAHDERASLYGADDAEIKQQRPAVVRLAALIGERLREEYRRRTQ